MARSSELVMRLNGSEASDGTEFDLVFGRSEGRPLLMTLLNPEEYIYQQCLAALAAVASNIAARSDTLVLWLSSAVPS